MLEIVSIKGATNFTINLDPSVWIFDQRKIEMESFLLNGEEQEVKEREATGSYGIPFRPFLRNAEPLPSAKSLICHLQDGSSITLTIEEAFDSILAFSSHGKPLKEDGIIHLHLSNGRHAEPPITHIIAFEVAE